MATYELRLPALEIRQGPRHLLYSLAVDGKLLDDFTTVSRVRRDDNSDLKGYQRPEILSHIAEIREYIESDSPMIPNALVIAFDGRVRFEPAAGITATEICRHGTLVVPVDSDQDDVDKPGWLVDGQQRAAAIRAARVSTFPVCVTAFITDNVDEQRSQFILVNSTKPLPKGLIYDLLPSSEGHLPTQLRRRQFPAVLLARLNYGPPEGPLLGKIKTPTNPKGTIKDNSILKMLENSLYDGALYHFRDSRTGEGEIESMLALLNCFWEAVARTFPEAWSASPRHSRLVHGAGIVSMGFIMDAIAEVHIFRGERPTSEEFEQSLRKLADVCCWTEGSWQFEKPRKWNEIQNTGKDITLLADYLLTEFRSQPQ